MSFVRLLSPWLLVLCASGSARAEWWVQSPDDSCATHAALVTRLRSTVPPEVVERGPRRTVRVAVNDGTDTVEILVSDATGRGIGSRSLTAVGSSCEELINAAIFVLATILEGDVETMNSTSSAMPTGESATALSVPITDRQTSGDDAARADPDFGEELEDNPVPNEVPNEMPNEPVSENLAEGGPSSDVGSADAAVFSTDSGAPMGPSSDEPARSADTPRPSTAFEKSRPKGARLWPLLAGVLIATGRVPNTGIGPRISFGWMRDRWAVRLGAGFLRGQDSLIGDLEGGIVAEHFEGMLDTCLQPEVGQWWRLGGCLGVAFGATRGAGQDFDENLTGTEPFLGVGAETMLQYRRGRFLTRLGIGATTYVMRGVFTVDDGGPRTAFAPSLIAFRTHLEVGVVFGALEQGT